MFGQYPLKQAKTVDEAGKGNLEQGFQTSRLRPSFHSTSVAKIMNKFVEKDRYSRFTLKGNRVSLKDHYYGENILPFWKKTKKVMQIHGWKKSGKLSYTAPQEAANSDRSLIPSITNISGAFPNITDLTLSLTVDNAWSWSFMNYGNDNPLEELTRKYMNAGFILSQNMSSIRHLTLLIHKYSKEGLAGFASEIGKYSQNLESLTIKFNELKEIDDEALKSLSTVLGRRFINLKKLSLDLKRCSSIRNSGLSYLLKTIGRRLLRLKELHLDTGSCGYISDGTIQGLEANVGQKLQNLESLTLSFYMCTDINDRSIQKLCSGTLSALPNLKQLALWVSLQKVTKSGLETLYHSISQHLVNLESLELRIFETSFVMHTKSPNLTDHEVQLLLAQISGSLKKLKKLSLTFDFCDGITDTGAGMIGSSISRDLSNLQKLRVYFLGSPNLTNAGFQALISGLCSHPTNLQALELNFKEPIKINDEGLDGVIQTMAEGLQQLKRLYLDFAGIQNVSAGVKQRLRQALQKIPVLKIKESHEQFF